MSNSILWNNALASHADEAAFSIWHDWIGDPDPGLRIIDEDPLFVTGPLGDYYLSQTSAGQETDSPGIDAGSDVSSNLGFDTKTNCTNGVCDKGRLDIGYHYPPHI